METQKQWVACGSETSNRVTVKSEGKLIATVAPSESDWKNAKLIAAAPELLEALLTIISDDPNIGDMPVVKKAIEKATK